MLYLYLYIYVYYNLTIRETRGCWGTKGQGESHSVHNIINNEPLLSISTQRMSLFGRVATYNISNKSLSTSQHYYLLHICCVYMYSSSN